MLYETDSAESCYTLNTNVQLYIKEGDMSTMIRKQVYIKPGQEARLKEIASRYGVPEAELIREGIDRALLLQPAAHKDKDAWDRIKDFIRRRSKKPHIKGQRKWKREDLYDRS